MKLVPYVQTYGDMEYKVNTEYQTIIHTYICAYDNNYMYKLYYISNVHNDKIFILYMYMDIIVY